MEWLSHATGPEWRELGGVTDPEYRPQAESFVKDLLVTENLVVLTGLGTSLCVTDDTGKRLAPTMGDLWNIVKNIPQFDQVLKTVKYQKPPSGDNVEVLLSQCQVAQSFDPQAMVAELIKAAERLIADKCRFVQPTTALDVHEAFLRKVARRSTRAPRMRLFTTNYDLCFELAASRSRFVVVDGFSHAYPQEFDGTYFGYDLVRREMDRETPDYISNVFHLYKLHGSIDWRLENTSVVKDSAVINPLIIYPRHTKYEASYEQPYLEMMSRFQIAVRQPNTAVLVVGFGFNDRHIVQPLMAAMRSNVSLKALVVSPNLKDITDPANDKANGQLAEIRRWIAGGDTRLALAASTFEELVPMIPDLIAQTESELYIGRLRFGAGGAAAQ